MPCHYCHMYGTWRSKEVRVKLLKQSFFFRSGGKPQKGEPVIMRGVDPFRHHKGSDHYVTLLFYCYFETLL